MATRVPDVHDGCGPSDSSERGVRLSSQPHYHVELGGTVASDPALFTKGTRYVDFMRFSLITLGLEVHKHPRWLRRGTSITFMGILVDGDVTDRADTPQGYCCGAGVLHFDPSPRPAGAAGTATGVQPFPIVTFAEETHRPGRPVTQAEIAAIVELTMATLGRVVGGDHGLPPISA